MRPPSGWIRRAAGAAALALACLVPASGLARPATVEDLLRREAFGAVALDPTERWLVVERRGPYQAAVRFDLDTLDDLARTTLWRIDLRGRLHLRPLFRAQRGVAYALGPFAPDGRHLAVLRLTARDWELGVATPATGAVRWLGVTPECVDDATTLLWADSDRLLVIARPRGDLPFSLRRVRSSALYLPDRWRAAARGALAVSVYGSGHAASVQPSAATTQLLQVDLGSGHRTVLARGRFVHMALAPDRRRVALLESDGDVRLDTGHPVQRDYGFERVQRRLRLLDLGARTLANPCPRCDVLLHPLAWSPDAQALLVFARQDGTPWTAGHLLRVAAATGAVRRADLGLTSRLDLRPEAARAGWFGGEPLVWAVPEGTPATAQPTWLRATASGPVPLAPGLAGVSRETLAVGASGALVLAEGAVWAIEPTGRHTRLATNVQPLAFTQVNRRWTFDYELPHSDPLLVRDNAGGSIVSVSRTGARSVASLPTGAEPLSAIGRHGALAIVRGPQGEQLTWIARSGRATPLAAINRQLADLEAPQVRAVHHRGPDGEALTSWLILPPHPLASPPPLIVRPYLGAVSTHAPGADLRARSYDKTIALLAGHGYAVLAPSLPARHDGEPARDLASRVLEIVAAAAADPDLKGRFDPQRLGLWGESFGGYSTLAIITQTDRFGAAIAQAATSDLFAEWGGFQTPYRVDPREGLSAFYTTGWVEDFQPEMGAPPWVDPARYVRNSPAWQADRVHTPLLLLHGDQDSFALAQPEQMFTALLRQNKEAELAIYWGQGHVIGGPGDLRDLYRRAFAWLDSHLTPTT